MNGREHQEELHRCQWSKEKSQSFLQIMLGRLDFTIGKKNLDTEFTHYPAINLKQIATLET